LATVYGIVQQSNGVIVVESAIGRGSTFKVFLPVTTASLSERATKPTTASTPRGSETILIVEDNDGARKLAQSVLTRQGYRVLDATSGEAALQLLESEPSAIHLVITDIVMTGMTGIELARRLGDKYPHLRVVFTSGYSSDVVLRHGEIIREQILMQKPYTPARLVYTVREALDAPRPDLKP
jgi:CheY-like chemotaxis protein